MKILGSLVFLNPTETLTSRLLCKHFLSTAFKFTSLQDHLVPVNPKETLSKVDLTAFQSNLGGHGTSLAFLFNYNSHKIVDLSFMFPFVFYTSLKMHHRYPRSLKSIIQEKVLKQTLSLHSFI